MTYQDSNIDDLFGWRNKQPDLSSDAGDVSAFTAVVTLCLAFCALYFGAQWYWRKPRLNRRKSLLKRICNFFKCARTPTI